MPLPTNREGGGLPTGPRRSSLPTTSSPASQDDALPLVPPAEKEEASLPSFLLEDEEEAFTSLPPMEEEEEGEAFTFEEASPARAQATTLPPTAFEDASPSPEEPAREASEEDEEASTQADALEEEGLDDEEDAEPSPARAPRGKPKGERQKKGGGGSSPRRRPSSSAGKGRGSSPQRRGGKSFFSLGGKSSKKEPAPMPPATSQDDFVDTKAKKLRPYGSSEKKQGKRLRTQDFDDKRKDLRKSSNVKIYIIIFTVLALALFGVYRIIWPTKGMDAQQVTQLAQAAAGETGFPQARGEGFAKDFMQAYLTIDPKNGASSRVLGYYYTGALAEADTPNRLFSNNMTQKILYGPTVYGVKALTPYSATYVVGALVEAESSSVKAPADGSAAKWTFFNVNVYFDKEKDSLLVTPESPTIVPAVEVGNKAELPDEAKIGTGAADDTLAATIKPVVVGYLKGYAVSSAKDHTALDQYIIPDPYPELLKGLDRRYALSDEEADAVKITAYPTEDPSVVKARVVVNWTDTLGPKNDIVYTSTYLIAMQKQANGKYLVGKFAPLYYVKD